MGGSYKFLTSLEGKDLDQKVEILRVVIDGKMMEFVVAWSV